MSVSRRRPPATATRLPYPAAWESKAELRVLRAASHEWGKLPEWSEDMGRRGWRLLRVATENAELVAVFGKTRLPAAG